MALQSIKIDEKAKTMTIVMDLGPIAASKSGKSRVVATTRGNTRTDATVDGKPITLGLNAYIPV